jgi:hypothetical protein
VKNLELSNRQLAFIAWLLLAAAVGVPSITHPQAPRWEQSLPAMRLQVDAPRNRAWVLNPDAVYVYDIVQKKLIKRIELPDWSFAGEPFGCAPDLALAPSGAALVTSDVVPTVWEIDAKDLTARQHRLALDADNDKDVGFTALVFDGRGLFGVSAPLGSAWKLDLAAGKAQKVKLAGALRDKLQCGWTSQ